MAGYACKTIKLSYICNPVSEIPVGIQLGSIAQLVQSVCLTSRGSGVRLPLLPLEENDLIQVILFFCIMMLRIGLRFRVYLLFLWFDIITAHAQDQCSGGYSARGET